MVRHVLVIFFVHVTHVLKVFFISRINPDGPEQRAFLNPACRFQRDTQTDRHAASLGVCPGARARYIVQIRILKTGLKAGIRILG